MPISFQVDAVEPAPFPAQTTPLGPLMGPYLSLGLNPELQVIPSRETHPLLGAVHFAFLEHRPLVLSPDALWLTITAGLAHHIKLNAERLRERFVRHPGRKILEVKHDELPQTPEGWARVASAFGAAIAEALGKGPARLLLCDFSTTGPAERCASEIVLMDAMSCYFDCLYTVVCGIPELTLAGTPEDWRKLRARLDVILEYELGFWTDSLVPIADKLVEAAEGRPDRAFFKDIYKPQRAYGRDRITGWIARLYPYVRGDDGVYAQRNPLLQYRLDEELPAQGPSALDEPVGIRSQDVPSGPSRALVRVQHPKGSSVLAFEGGLLAIEQDTKGRLIPRAGFVIREAQGGAALLVEQLCAEHQVQRASPERSAEDTWWHDAELRIFFEAIGSATLRFGDVEWRLLPRAARERIELAQGGGPRSEGKVDMIRLFDLSDGSVLGIVEGHDGLMVRVQAALLGETYEREDRWTESKLLVRRCHQPLQSIPIVGHSLFEVLDRARSGAPLEPKAMLLNWLPDWWDSEHHAASLLERLAAQAELHQLELEPGRWHLFGRLRSAKLRIKDSTWSVEPAAGALDKLVDIHLKEGFVISLRRWIELGDGTFLASGQLYGWPTVVRLRADRAKPVTNPSEKYQRWEQEQPLDSIEVLGRSLVEVLEHALEHGALPQASKRLAELHEELAEGYRAALKERGW